MTGTRASLALIALALLSACTRVNGGNGQHPSAGRNAWTHPGELRIATRQDPDNLNMLLGTQSIDTDLSMFWAGYLFNWNDRNELVPELADRVPTLANGDIAPSGTTIVYHLRRGVQWQDGAPFGADDVIYTWRQIMNPANNTVSRFGYDLVTAIDKHNDQTIVVHLKKPFAPFVNTFFSMANHSDQILPKHLLSRYPDINRVTFNTLPIGTGPFRVQSYERGQRIRFVANERYWRGPPRLRAIDFRFIPNDNTILTLARSHEIDFWLRAPEALAPSLHLIEGTRVVITPFTRFADIGLNAGSPALADVRVRQALAYATDRHYLVDKVTHNVARVGNTDQPEGFWAHNPSARSYPYDPARAAALLDSAGWKLGAGGLRTKNGETLRLTLISYTGSSTIDESEAIVQRQWHDLGIDVTIKNFPSSQLYATKAMGGIEQSGRFDAVFENWNNGVDPDDSILFACGMAPPAGWNVYHFCDPQVEAAEQTALKSNDPRIRKAAYDTIQSRLAEEVPIIMLWYQSQQDVVNTDFKGYRPAHAVTPFWNTWEWSI